MNIVTGYKGEPHVTSWQDRDLNQGIFGADTYILNVGSKLAASIISNNEIHIADGVIMMQGCEGVVQKGTYDTISIDNGSQGLARHDLICAQYSKNGSTGVESMSLVVIKGTAAATATDPSYTSGDIQNGDTLVQVPLYRVVLSGLTVTGVEQVADNIGNIGALKDAVTTMAQEVLMRSGSTTITLSSNESVATPSIALSAGTWLIHATLSNNMSVSNMRVRIYYDGAQSTALNDTFYGSLYQTFASRVITVSDVTMINFAVSGSGSHSNTTIQYAIDCFKLR